MKRLLSILLTLIIASNAVLANYTGTYGKVDNLEIGLDMLIDFLVQLAPFMFFIFLALLIWWGYKRLLGN